MRHSAGGLSIHLNPMERSLLSVRGRIFVALASLAFSAAAQADEMLSTSVEWQAEHATPRLKASYRTFTIAGLDETPVRLQGVQLDAYAVSERWLRVGFELEGGTGSAGWALASATLGYGLVGLTVGVQYPARVTPFVEGRFFAGVLAGVLDGTDEAAATWLYGGGVEAGVEVYLHGRTYLSAAVGWMRSSWRGVDVNMSTAGNLVYTDLVADSFTVKVGIGF